MNLEEYALPGPKRERPLGCKGVWAKRAEGRRTSVPQACVTGTMKGRAAPEQRWYHEAGFVL